MFLGINQKSFLGTSSQLSYHTDKVKNTVTIIVNYKVIGGQ